ncbi:hypothetical protein NKH17_26730 [Mesorhizobium sp. M1334]|uniref:hypothetical protein n=1 Tax=Mesorhizobium sp. M1334 TaxID=2957084 RepID=UPI003335D818
MVVPRDAPDRGRRGSFDGTEHFDDIAGIAYSVFEIREQEVEPHMPEDFGVDGKPLPIQQP